MITKWARLYLLPAEFHHACHWAQLTAGAGIKPGGRLRLAFSLDRAVSGEEAKLWLRSAPVDLSLYSAVQPHWTARPRFVRTVDPVRPRPPKPRRWKTSSRV